MGLKSNFDTDGGGVWGLEWKCCRGKDQETGKEPQNVQIPFCYI